MPMQWKIGSFTSSISAESFITAVVRNIPNLSNVLIVLTFPHTSPAQTVSIHFHPLKGKIHCSATSMNHLSEEHQFSDNMAWH